MPTYREQDPVKLKQLREEEDTERDFLLEQMQRKEAHDLEMVREKGKVRSEALKMTHRATSRAGVWVALFSILPKCLLIISSFWLILCRREVPNKWTDYISR